jgi:hypothetical protein
VLFAVWRRVRNKFRCCGVEGCKYLTMLGTWCLCRHVNVILLLLAANFLEGLYISKRIILTAGVILEQPGTIYDFVCAQP